MTTTRFNPRTTKPQTVRNWIGKDVHLVFAGKCIGCGANVYDGAEDPRGVTGPRHYNAGLELSGDAVVTFPACFECMNDASAYERARTNAINTTALPST